MERTTAIKKLKKLLGPKCYWRIGDKITSPERRAETKTFLLETEFSERCLARDMKVRAAELMAADTLYQSLKADWQSYRDKIESSRQKGEPAFRFEVGTQSGGALNVVSPKAYGDTWEEIFEKLQSNRDEVAS